MSQAQVVDYYCVIGNPIAHSRSPAIHTRFAELTGEKLVYERQLFQPGRFDAQLRHLAALHSGAHSGYRLRGCNVTVPFKFDAAAFPGQATYRVSLSGAANTLMTDGQAWSADNTDGQGLVGDITGNAGVVLEDQAILLLGAGGASAGVIAALLEARPKRLTVANRSPEKAQLLVQRHLAFAAQHQVELVATDLDNLAASGHQFDILINATAAGLQGQHLALRPTLLKHGGLGYDMMYGEKALPFMTWVQERGGRALDGLGMLVEQAAQSFQIWRGVKPPAQQVLSELRLGSL
jgi:shikimate dehydrogenase